MTPDHTTQLLARVRAAEAEAREATRTLAYALDDLAAAHETMRQLRVELAAVLTDTSASGDASVPAHALVIEHGPCGRPEVVR